MTEFVGANPCPPMLGLLLRVKVRSLWNRIRQAVDEAPVRVSTTVLLVGLIWLGLYGVFLAVFQQFQETPLEATVAIPLLFSFFFVAMLAMLTFSNAIIVYGALYGRTESAYLLTSPATPRDVVTLKYLESLVMASWSLVLLGLPLMMAIAHRTDEPYFHTLFLAFFLAFIPIPGGLGLLLAWAAARFFPRRATRWVAVVGGVVVGVFVVAGLRSLGLADMGAEVWLRSFLARMNIVESALLPNHWVAAGIDHALHGRLPESMLYLGVTFANGLFVSWLAVIVVSRYFDTALDRSAASSDRGRRPASSPTGGVAGRVFFYLPRPLRLVAAKDLRTFLRDPLQWSQLVILFGLMALYLTNMPTLRLVFAGSSWGLIVPFLNLCAVSLILATFTCRFVFPLISLEGQKLWLIGLLPMRRGLVLRAKFAFAMTVTVVTALCVMGLASVMLLLPPWWALIHLGVTFAICFGLCGFAVGIGARLPMFHQPNVARIANGLGGTSNLLASIALVAVALTGVALATYRSRNGVVDAMPDAVSLLLCGGGALLAVLAGAAAMWIGGRHFDRVEA